MTMQMVLAVQHRQIQSLRADQHLALRLDLTQVLRDEKCTPQAICPNCSYELSPIEILRGFRDDPHDFTTCCPKPQCTQRFEARLQRYVGTSGASSETRFYCAMQTTAQLTPELAQLSQEALRRAEPSLYFSALTHYGTLARAFAAADLKYPHTEIRDWQDKVAGFLGRLPDTAIAECAGVSVKRVRELRRFRQISPYKRETT